MKHTQGRLVITITMANVIDAGNRRIWRALTKPEELIGWDEHILAPVEERACYPVAGTPMRWRYRLGSVQVVLCEKPLEVVAPSRLRSELQIGSLRYEQTISLRAESESRTRVSMREVAENSIPLIGDEVNRFAVRTMMSERIDEALQALRAWCENDP